MEAEELREKLKLEAGINDELRKESVELNSKKVEGFINYDTTYKKTKKC